MWPRLVPRRGSKDCAIFRGCAIRDLDSKWNPNISENMFSTWSIVVSGEKVKNLHVTDYIMNHQLNRFGEDEFFKRIRKR